MPERPGGISDTLPGKRWCFQAKAPAHPLGGASYELLFQDAGSLKGSESVGWSIEERENFELLTYQR